MQSSVAFMYIIIASFIVEKYKTFTIIFLFFILLALHITNYFFEFYKISASIATIIGHIFFSIVSYLAIIKKVEFNK